MMRPLFSHLSIDNAKSYGLVLTSLGIPHQMSPCGSFWAINVETHYRRRAVEAISLYINENRPDPDTGRRFKLASARTYSAFYIGALLVLIHMAVIPGYERQVFVGTFGADAARILSGEPYRCVTALLFHADEAHLLGNLAALAVFGTAAASLCGWGVGWLMILASGTAGNFVTALWYRQDHIAIGSSTAVFGAVGICAALSFWMYAHRKPRSRRMWLPLAGGLALLAFMGTSPHSDLMAHLLGFVCGALIGILYGRWYRRMLPWTVQLPAAVGSAMIVGVGWLWGMTCS